MNLLDIQFDVLYGQIVSKLDIYDYLSLVRVNWKALRMFYGDIKVRSNYFIQLHHRQKDKYDYRYYLNKYYKMTSKKFQIKQFIENITRLSVGDLIKDSIFDVSGNAIDINNVEGSIAEAKKEFNSISERINIMLDFLHGGANRKNIELCIKYILHIIEIEVSNVSFKENAESLFELSFNFRNMFGKTYLKKDSSKLIYTHFECDGKKIHCEYFVRACETKIIEYLYDKYNTMDIESSCSFYNNNDWIETSFIGKPWNHTLGNIKFKDLEKYKVGCQNGLMFNDLQQCKLIKWYMVAKMWFVFHWRYLLGPSLVIILSIFLLRWFI